MEKHTTNETPRELDAAEMRQASGSGAHGAGGGGGAGKVAFQDMHFTTR